MVDTSPTISVVLATHNGQAFLEKQLASLAGQTRLPHELVVSDDASTDRTNELVERFRAQAPFPVRHHRNPVAKGFRDNFLGATAHASGDWIAFCDQDDVWHPDKLALCAPHMATPGVTQVVHQATLIDGSDRTTGMFAQGIARSGTRPPLAYDVWGTFWGFSMLVDRRLLGLADPARRFIDYIDPRHRVAHDRWAFFLAQTLGCTVEIAQPLAGYRQHDSNLFGHADAGARRKSAASLKAENLAYIAATQGMLQIVESLPPHCEQWFPAFDRARASAVYRRALAQLRQRDAIYDAGAAAALWRGLRMLVRGDYRNAQNRSLRWRSFLRDMTVSLARRP